MLPDYLGRDQQTAQQDRDPRDMPRLIGYAETGQLDIGAMVSRTIDLTQINDGFRAMKDGEVIRSVITSF